jgi:hypothetical protein
MNIGPMFPIVTGSLPYAEIFCENPACPTHKLPPQMVGSSPVVHANNGPITNYEVTVSAVNHAYNVDFTYAMVAITRKKMRVTINGVEFVLHLCSRCAEFIEGLGGEEV